MFERGWESAGGLACARIMKGQDQQSSLKPLTPLRSMTQGPLLTIHSLLLYLYLRRLTYLWQLDPLKPLSIQKEGAKCKGLILLCVWYHTICGGWETVIHSLWIEANCEEERRGKKKSTLPPPKISLQWKHWVERERERERKGWRVTTGTSFQ